MRGSFIAGLLAFAALLIANRLHPTVYNNYVLLAEAFRHGHVWIDWPGDYIDALGYHGRRYVIEAPLPALLALPAVLVWGTATNQSILSAALGGLAVGAGWEITRRLTVPIGTRIWLCGFLLFGTDLFWCAMYGDVWFTAHVAAAAFTLLALAEMLGKRRGWVVAIFAACAVESRFSLLMAVPVYAAWLAIDGTFAERRGRVLQFALTLVPFVGLWVGYNEMRWHLPFDIGYTAWYHQDQAGESTGSPFRLSYLRYQLYSFFVRFPDVSRHPPFLIPTYDGVALTWTSPALLVALAARGNWTRILALWVAAVLVALPSLVYYVNGFAQFGMRHALDFEPFIFVLMALAVRNGIGPVGRILCAWSILVGAWGIWYWKNFYRPL